MRPQALVAGAVVLGAAFPYPIYGPREVRVAGIADEPRFYPPAVVDLRQRQAAVVARALAGTHARVMIEGGMCMFGYFSHLPYLVEMTGLTQYSLARAPLRRRGRVGHEKHPDAQWLTDHDIQIIVSHDPPAAPPDHLRYDDLYFSNAVRARTWRYDDDLMNRLQRRPGVRFTPIEDVTAAVRRQINESDAADAASAYAFLDRFYLRAAGAKASATARALRALLDEKRAAGAAPSRP